jgi:glyoxylase-like metal-dependent hydrolase (beta-lactamase superfamily II)
MNQVAPGIHVVPVRTPTLPPATHTNTYVVGDGAMSVFDPASPYEQEQALLLEALQLRIDTGETVERLVLTHHHPDHVSGTTALQASLRDLGLAVPIVAHPVTARLVAETITVDVLWEDQAVNDCGGRSLRAHFTPGHAPGHLVFEDMDSHALIAGDMVAGVGTIVVDPIDGDLGLYLESLALMQALDPSVLLPAHGPALPEAQAILAFYIAHRHSRTEQMREALDHLGEANPLDIVARVYGDTIPTMAYPIAAAQVLSHLLWMATHGIASPTTGTSWRLTQ